MFLRVVGCGLGGIGKCWWLRGRVVRWRTGQDLLVAGFWFVMVSSGARVIAIDAGNGHRGISKNTNRGAVRTECDNAMR